MTSWTYSGTPPRQPCDCIAYLSMEQQEAAYPHLDAFEKVRWNGEAWEMPDVMLGMSFQWVRASDWPCPPPRTPLCASAQFAHRK